MKKKLVSLSTMLQRKHAYTDIRAIWIAIVGLL